MNLQIKPLTQKNWPDLEKLFGDRGAVGGCWCMWWRIRRSDYEKKRESKINSHSKRSFLVEDLQA